MQTVYFFCAVIGGTALLWQLAMSVLGGVGDHDLGVDHDVGGDAGFHDGGMDHAGGADHAGAHDGSADAGHAHAGAGSHGSWFLGMLTFRTVVAAIAFFGFAGMAGSTGGLPPLTAFALAVACGFAALYLVAWLMQGLTRLRAEGTAYIRHALGQPGTVYLTIPAQRAGAGKVTLNVQNRTMEYEAVTAAHELPTGTNVVVVRIVGPETLEVAAAVETQ